MCHTLIFCKQFIIVSMLTSRQKSPVKNTYKNLIPILNNSIKIEDNRSSLLFRNRLTKTYFSLHDTSLQNRSNLDKSKLSNPKQIEHIFQWNRMRERGSKSLYRLQSQPKQVTHSEYHQITQSYIPKIKFVKPNANKTTNETFKSKIKSQGSARSNKFHLLFKQPSTARRSVSQRKIERIDKKIHNIKKHNKFMQMLRPPPKEMTEKTKILPKGVIVNQDRINKLARALIRNLCLYFSMYKHPKKVGDILKSCDGYNATIHKIFFQSCSQVKQMKNQSQIEKYFWVFQEESKRPQFFGEEDFNLYNNLQNYSLKLERSYGDVKKNFLQFQELKMQSVKKQIAKKLSINEKKLKSNNEINNVVQFIDSRRRHNQDRRQASLKRLESLGVLFNIQERTKQLTIREKEKIMKACLISDLKQ